MKKLDAARFQKAFEQPPKAFHDMVEQALSACVPMRKGVSSRRMVLLFAVVAVLLMGAAAAVVHRFTLDDFLGFNLEERGVQVTSQLSVTGTMDLVNVRVKEAASDGMFMYLTVQYSLKDDQDSALIFGDDMAYALETVRAHQTLPNHLDIAAFNSAKNRYWLQADRLTCLDNLGGSRDSYTTFTLYESPVSVVVMYWMDIRAEDAFDAFLFPENAAGYPEAISIAMNPKLYVYKDGAKPAAAEDAYHYIGNLADYLALADAADLHMDVPLKRDTVQKKYWIANFPKQIGDLVTLEATVTETSMVYTIRLDFQRKDGTAAPDYDMILDLLDEKGEPCAYISMYQNERAAQNEPGAVDFRVETNYPKSDGLLPHTLAVYTYINDIALPSVEMPWKLDPIQ